MPTLLSYSVYTKAYSVERTGGGGVGVDPLFANAMIHFVWFNLLFIVIKIQVCAVFKEFNIQ